MWIITLETAIYNRITSDNGAGGIGDYIAPQALYAGEAPPQTTDDKYPYVVFNVFQDSIEEPCFDLEVVPVRVLLEVYGLRSRKGDERDALANVLNRLYGDAAPGSGTAPTHGLHRWLPTLSGWDATAMIHQQHQPLHTDTHWIYTDEYTLTVSRAGKE